MPIEDGKSRPRAQAHHDFYVHIDMDCFFASVALLEFPSDHSIHNQPVVVAHTGSRYQGGSGRASASASASGSGSGSGRGGGGGQEVSSANYVARKYGIRAGMFVVKVRLWVMVVVVVQPRYCTALALGIEGLRVGVPTCCDFALRGPWALLWAFSFEVDKNREV